MRLIRARALLSLRRDADAQADLQDCLQRKTRCAPAYRLLGELCFRRDDFSSAKVFLGEAARLEPSDESTGDLLAVVKRFLQPTAAVDKLPAANASVGCPFSCETRGAPTRPPRLAQASQVTQNPTHVGHDDADLAAPTEFGAYPVSRFDLPPEDLTEAMDSITIADPPSFSEHDALDRPMSHSFDVGAADGPPTVRERRRSRIAFGSEFEGEPTVPERSRKSQRARRRNASQGRRSPHTTTDDFGHFLIHMGALTPNQLHSARDYKRRRGLDLARAVVALGYASEPTVRTASLAFRASHRKPR